MKNEQPTEEKCKDCDFLTYWSGPYGGCGGYPACTHRDSGPRATNLLSEMERCPKD